MWTLPRTLLAAAVVLSAFASHAQYTRIRGTIENAQANTLTLKLTDGTQSKLVLAPNATMSVW